MIAEAFSREEILVCWNWLADNIFKVLLEMESFEEITNFTNCKIQSLVAQQNIQANRSGEATIGTSDNSQSRFKRLFALSDDDKLVSHYTCK